MYRSTIKQGTTLVHFYDTVSSRTVIVVCFYDKDNPDLKGIATLAFSKLICTVDLHDKDNPDLKGIATLPIKSIAILFLKSMIKITLI